MPTRKLLRKYGSSINEIKERCVVRGDIFLQKSTGRKEDQMKWGEDWGMGQQEGKEGLRGTEASLKIPVLGDFGTHSLFSTIHAY